MLLTTGPRDLVTPEGVVLDFPTAGVASRALAKVIDILVQLVMLNLVLFVVGMLSVLVPDTGDLGGVVAAVFAIVAAFLVLIGYPVAFEAGWGGRTPGKAVVGLRVRTREGGPIRFRHAAVRTLIGLGECFLLPFLAIVSCTWSTANQRLGDLAAGTIVVRERTGAPGSSALRFPPPAGLDNYVQSLDITAMSSDQYNFVRSFLTRVLELDPISREVLATRFAGQLARVLHHDRPAGLHPEVYLACAASAYQLRHIGPLTGPLAPGWAPPTYRQG